VKKVLSLFLICIFILNIAACGSRTPESEREQGGTGGAGIGVGVDAEMINTHFEAFAYHRERVEFTSSGNFIQAATSHANQIYYAYIDFISRDNFNLIITNTDADGNETGRLEIQSPGNEIASFKITQAGNYAFMLFHRTIATQGFDIEAYYVEYDRNGTQLIQKEFGKFTLIDNPQNNTFVILNDGRIFALNTNERTLNELDFNSRDWGETLPFPDTGNMIFGIFPADANSSFDIFISDTSYLYGYNIEKNEMTVLFDWMQTGFVNIYYIHTGILDDERIFILAGDGNARGEWDAELYILTPVSRDEMPEKIILTMSGMTVSQDMRQAVAAFNNKNSDYRIEIYEYINQADYVGVTESADFIAVHDRARLRFQVDLMAGNIPDIIFNPTSEVYDRGFLIDLYPFIDADPDINRSDFFPSALSAMEWSDGTLLSFSNKFYIETIMSSYDLLGHIDKWTPAVLLTLIEQVKDKPFPFGAGFIRDNLIFLMLNTGIMGYIDPDNFNVNVDNDEFISLLKTAMMLPTYSDLPPDMWTGDIIAEILRMQKGEQLLSMQYFYNVNDYQYFTDSFPDSLTLGIPTENGGVHIIGQFQQIGIGAGTNHVDIVWEFLREFLLPSSVNFDRGMTGDLGLPLRIDLFDNLIEEAMIPNIHVNAAGESKELPRDRRLAQDGSFIHLELYAMSEETASGLRNIIESAVPLKTGLGKEIRDVITGDLVNFYLGEKTAEETARIIQNRAEIWMSEQKLMAGR